MTKLRSILAGLAVMGAQPVLAAQADPHAGHEAHAQHKHATGVVDPEVDAFVCNYFGLVEKGEPGAILDQIDKDFVIKWPVGQPITDREQLRSALINLQGKVRQTIRWKVLETGVHGDWAWARVNETSLHQPRAGGAERTLDGSHLMILRRDGGRWLLHRDYGSLNAMPVAAP